MSAILESLLTAILEETPESQTVGGEFADQFANSLHKHFGAEYFVEIGMHLTGPVTEAMDWLNRNTELKKSELPRVVEDEDGDLFFLNDNGKYSLDRPTDDPRFCTWDLEEIENPVTVVA